MSESSDRRDTLLATLLVNALCCLLLMQAKPFQMLVISCPDNLSYTCFFEKEENSAYSFITPRWTSLCLWQEVLYPGRFFPIWTLMSCHFAEGSHGTWPSGSNRGLTPCSLRWLGLPYFPTEDQGGRIKYPVINCTWHQYGIDSIVKIWLHFDNYFKPKCKG